MKETILVTGASGTIGRELVRYLITNNTCVRIAARDEQKIKEFQNSGCPVINFDYEKKNTYDKAFEGISGFYLSVPLWRPCIDELILPAIESAKKHGVTHIVSLGAIGLQLDNETPLSILEQYVKHCGLQFTILRPNLLMQTVLSLSSYMVKQLREIRLPAGDARISFVDARDVAEAAAIALVDPSHRNKAYNLTGSEALSHSEIANILSRISGSTISYIPVSHNEALKNLTNEGWPSEKISMMVGLYEIARHGWCEAVFPDLANLLDHEPMRFEQFAEDYLQSWIVSNDK
jgi:uncharacterized protein YbjT (DUF2867 family)